MSKEITDFTEEQLRSIFNKAGLSDQDVDKAVAEYQSYRESELSSLSTLSYKEIKDLGAEALTEEVMKMKGGEEIITKILSKYERHSKRKKAILDAYNKLKDWDKVIDEEIYLDESQEAEPFIETIETLYKTKIKDAKHLQKLTGIKETPIEWLEKKLIEDKVTKYERRLSLEIGKGAKYKELLQIKPKEYGLPESWGKNSNQYNSILWAISNEFMIGETLTVSPSLRIVAKEIDAPYSVLMDCYKLTNW